MTICNLHHEEKAELRIETRGLEARKATGRILTGPAMDSHNTFEHPETVKPAVFDGLSISKGVITCALPARSVVALEIA